MVPNHTGGLGDAAFVAALHQGGAVSVFTLFLYDRFKMQYFLVHILADSICVCEKENNPLTIWDTQVPF